MANWFNKKQDTDETQGEFDPSKFQESVVNSTKAELEAFKTELTSKLGGVEEITNYFKEQKAEVERRKAAEIENKRKEETEVDADLWITNPEEAARRTNEPLERRQQALAAITMRREVLGDKEFYTGEVKEKVDAMIEQQPLAARANSSVLLNCYKVVLGDYYLKGEGDKLKKQAAFTSFNGNGTGGSGAGGGKESEETLSPEELDIARKFGMSDKDWITSKKELNYV